MLRYNIKVTEDDISREKMSWDEKFLSQDLSYVSGVTSTSYHLEKYGMIPASNSMVSSDATLRVVSENVHRNGYCLILGKEYDVKKVKVGEKDVNYIEVNGTFYYEVKGKYVIDEMLKQDGESVISGEVIVPSGSQDSVNIDTIVWIEDGKVTIDGITYWYDENEGKITLDGVYFIDDYKSVTKCKDIKFFNFKSTIEVTKFKLTKAFDEIGYDYSKVSYCSYLYFINFNGECHNIAFTKNKEDGSFTFFCDYNGKELPLFFKVSDIYIELNSANLASNGIEGVYDYESLKSITSYVKVSCEDGGVYVEVEHDVINANVVSSTTKPMHKETVKSIRSVMSLSELLATPSDDVASGNITYVTNVDKNVMIIDDTVYKIYTDSDGKRFVKFLKEGDSVKVTNSKYFSDDLTVFDSDFNDKAYDIYNSQSGLIIRAYIKADGSFKCFSNNDGAAAIQSFMIMGDSQDGYSNYFILDDNQFSHMMARKYEMTDGTSTISEGWRRLKYSDDDYKRISTITNYFGGNNPHNGNMVYDNGYEYFSYFKELFKYACDNYLFDERCFDNVDASIDDEIKDIGFSSLTSSNYSNGLTSDSKVHYFGNYVMSGTSKEVTYDTMDKMDCSAKAKNMYGLTDKVTNQIMNTKRMCITFYLDKFKDNNKFKDNKWNQVKYLDDIIMSYLTQMIPSTTILSIKYVTRNN